MPVIHKILLALEPEAAAIYCQNITAQQLAPYCESVPPFTSKSSFLVVDIGGGTVDISAHRFSSSPEQHIEVILPPAGNDCGGSMVNKNFEEFLGELVGDKTFSEFIDTGDETVNATHRAKLNELINDTFERQKRIFGEKGGKGSKVSIHLPHEFMEHYRSKLVEGISKLKDTQVQLSGIDIQIAYPKMEEFFQPVVEGLLQCMSEALLSLDEIETIYIVGGFGGCRYIYNAITEEFGNKYKYITPVEPDFAVVCGAVLFRQNPDIAHAHRADATYGVRVNIPFQEGKHEEDYKWVNEKGEPQCENIFSTFVEKGDIVPTSEVVVMEYAPAKLHQQRMHIDIYSSPEKDVWYTTGRRPTGTDLADVQKIGELAIPFPKQDTEEGAQCSDKQLITDIQRKVEVTFDFSHTEIQVRGYDKLSKTEVKVVLDFLSS